MKLSFTIAKKRTDYDPKMGKLNMNQFYSLRVPVLKTFPNCYASSRSFISSLPTYM